MSSNWNGNDGEGGDGNCAVTLLLFCAALGLLAWVGGGALLVLGGGW